jgi:hypothetical protein
MGIRDFSKTKHIQLEELFEKHFAMPGNTHVSILREFDVKYSRRIGNIKNRELVQNYSPYRTISIKYEVFGRYKNIISRTDYKIICKNELDFISYPFLLNNWIGVKQVSKILKFRKNMIDNFIARLGIESCAANDTTSLQRYIQMGYFIVLKKDSYNHKGLIKQYDPVTLISAEGLHFIEQALIDKEEVNEKR